MAPLTMCPGTAAYMPPEALITPPQYSSKLDCFSYGVLTIQIATRQFPNPGDAHQYIIMLRIQIIQRTIYFGKFLSLSVEKSILT